MAHAGCLKAGDIGTATVFAEGSDKWIICRPIILDHLVLLLSVKLNCFHCSLTFVIEYSHSWEATGFESKGLLHLFE